jgi:hypothetical protein
VKKFPHRRCPPKGRLRSALVISLRRQFWRTVDLTPFLFWWLFCLTPGNGWSTDASRAPAPSERVPIQAELVRSIEAGKTRVGDPVYARVMLEWKNSECALRQGAMLRGRVVAEARRVKGAKSELALVFESGQCNGVDLKPIALTVAALLAPDPNRNTSLFSGEESQPLSDAVGLSLGQEGTGSPMRSVLTAASTVLLEPPQNKPPVLVMPGQVIGLGDMKLGVGSGPEGSSVLSSARHNLRLEMGSRLVIVASAGAPPGATGSNPSDAPPTSPQPASATAEPDVVGESDSCAVPGCDAVTDNRLLATNVVAAAFRMPVSQLGFAVPVDREMYTLDRDVTLSYLGAKKVLLTFNPHGLILRSSSDLQLPKLHIVRALLMEVGPSSKVLHSADWRIYDAKQYLWPISAERVLVHVGNELRIYGPDLKEQRKIALGGPLAYVAVAPSSRYFAVGVIHERHSDSVHRELAEAEGREPEEDIEVKVLDSDFHAWVNVIRSSREAPPILSDDGEIRVPAVGKNRWTIAEYTWTGQRRVLKQVESTCRPSVTTLPPNLLFVTGCDRLSDGKWYRTLRSDGKLVLKGQSSSAELGQVASGVADSNLFAVGITEMEKSIVESSAFHSKDLKNLRIGVFRVENGKRVAAMVVSDPLPTVQTFALSPDGSQLAVIANDEMFFYALPPSLEHEP